MTEVDSHGWLASVRVDPRLLRGGAMLHHETLPEFAADLVAVIAGARTPRNAIDGFLRERRLDLAARCAWEAEAAERAELDQQIQHAWGDLRSAWERRLEDARKVLERCQRAVPFSDDLSAAEADLRRESGALEEKIAAWPRWSDDTLCERLRKFTPQEERALQYQSDLLDLAAGEVRSILERLEREQMEGLQKLKLQGDALVNELVMSRTLHPEARDRVLAFSSELIMALSTGDMARMSLAIEALQALARGELPAPPAPLQPTPTPAAPRRPDEAPFDESSLSRIAQKEVLERLDPNPGTTSDASWWEAVLLAWDTESAEPLRRPSPAPTRADAIGAQVILKARAALLAGERDRAYLFALDAIRWGLSEGVSALPLSRYQDGAVWCLLHAISLAAHAERWSPARFDTESRDLRGAVVRVERFGLIADLSEALLTLRHRGVACFERWLGPLLVDRRATMRALVAGLVDTFPQDPLWLWRLLVTVLRTELPGLEAGDDGALDRRAPRVTTMFRSWRAVQLDHLKSRLQPLCDQSGLADEAIVALEHVEQRLERGTNDQEPGVALALLTPEVAAGRRSLAVLRLTLNDERRTGIRGLRVEARFAPEGAGRGEAIVVTWLPKDVPVEVAVPVERQDEGEASISVLLTELSPEGARAQVSTRTSTFTLTFTPPYSRPPNPYILKDAVQKAALVYGRADTIQRVLRTLRGAHQLNPVLVLGARRIGKTSFLNAVCEQEEVRANFVVARIDFQSVTATESIEVFFLTRMMRGIQERLAQERMLVQIREDHLRENPHTAFGAFMDAVEGRLHAQGRWLLLVIDEIEKVAAAARVDAAGRPHSVGEEVLASLRAVMQRARRVGFLLAGSTDGVRRYQRNYHSRLFQLAEEVELTSLDNGSARELLERQSQPHLTWRTSAIEAALRDTAGDPSLLQLVGFRVFEALTGRCGRTVTGHDVRAAIDDIIENPKDFWAFSESVEDAVDRTLVRVIADLQADPVRRERESARGRVWVRRSWIAGELRRRGLTMDPEILSERLDRLCYEVPNVLARNPGQPRRDLRIVAGLYARYLVSRLLAR